MTASTGGQTVKIGGPLFPRLMGWWMCVIAVFGLVGSVRSLGFPGFLVVALVWATPAFWWGWRLTRLGIVAGPDELEVRNPLRTHRVAYDDIVDVRMRRRVPSGRPSAAFRALYNRAVGEVEVRGRAKPFEMQTTESLWSGGRALSLAGKQTARDVEVVRQLCQERRRT